MKHRVIVMTLATAALALALPGCGTGEARQTTAGTPESNPPLPVEVAMPKIADVYATYYTTAAITADQEALVPARVAGEVVEILVEEGDTVEAGPAPAPLDGERLRPGVLQAEDRLDMGTRAYKRGSSLPARGVVSASALLSSRFSQN